MQLSSPRPVSDRAMFFVAVAAVSAAVTVVAGSIAFAWDFRSFWMSARWFRAGANIYQGTLPNLNMPATVLLFWPFSFLPFAWAAGVWTGLALALYVGTSIRIARAVAPGCVLQVVLAVLASQTTMAALLAGQVTGFLMLLLTSAWLADRDDREVSAGLLAGVALGMKPFLGVFVGYAVWRRSWRFAGGLLVGIVTMGGLGLAVGGVAGYRAWMAVLPSIDWIPNIWNASLLGVISRLFTVSAPGLLVSPLAVRPGWVWPLWTAGATAIVVSGAHALARTKDRDRAWAVTLSTALLLSPLGWAYYVPAIAGPFVAMAFSTSLAVRRLVMAGYACFLVPFQIYAGPLGPLATLTRGSAYGLGLLLLFLAAVFAEDRAPNADRRDPS